MLMKHIRVGAMLAYDPVFGIPSKEKGVCFGIFGLITKIRGQKLAFFCFI